MAVVQISRIQVRRGKSLAGTGLPQLASGELAWSLDTQELYIGNGSVAEGAPAVGNTKILTERDLTVQGNLLALIQHIYKTDDPAIQTGPTPNDPISRRTQDRLDDRVTAADFGTVSNGVADDTMALQRAIDQLFLNSTTKASSQTADGTKSRIILELGAGVYKTTETLYIPSYATIVGAGADKTIIEYNGVGPAIQFVNDTSTIGNPSTIGNTLANTQPRHIIMKGLTVYTTTDNQTALQLDAVRDSYFEDLIIKGDWGGTYDSNSIGISMKAVSALVTCSDNIFNRIVITGFSYAVNSMNDISNNTFSDCSVYDVRQGFVLGENSDGNAVGQQYGPRQTQILRCKFDDVKRHAVYVERGYGNTTRDCKLSNVGNNGSGVYFPQYPQIFFDAPGNTSENDQSDREDALSSLSFTVDLTMSSPVTATQDSLVIQSGTNVQGRLKEDYASDDIITVVTRYTTPFNNLGNLTIGNSLTPGATTTIEIIGSDTSSFETSDSTDELAIGSAIKFSGTMGGVVVNTTYYVQNINDSTHFSISNTLGGALKTLTSSSGSMNATFHATSHPIAVGNLNMVPYVPEVAGYVTYKSYATRQVSLGFITSPSLVTVLPLSTGPSGNPSRSISYTIEYVYKSSVFNFTRRGVMLLVIDVDSSISNNATKAQLSDDYNVTGLSEEDSLQLDFKVELLNELGDIYSGVGDTPTSVALQYTNTLSLGTTTLTGFSGTISAAGVLGNSYQSTVTGIVSTTGLSAGQVLTKTSGVGSFGANVYIYSVDGPNQITIRSSSAHTTGSVNFSSTTLSSDNGTFTYSYKAIL
jgi:hypothetical protein